MIVQRRPPIRIMDYLAYFVPLAGAIYVMAGVQLGWPMPGIMP